jgi:hypothetical protein
MLLDDHFSNLCNFKIVANSLDILKSVTSAVDSNRRLSIFFKTDPQLRPDIIAALVGNASGL